MNALSELQRKHNEEVKKLMAEYAKSNNEVEIGDIVTDGVDSIIVDKFRISCTGEGIPAFIYGGVVAKKNGSPRKSGIRSTIWQPLVKEIKKNPKR